MAQPVALRHARLFIDAPLAAGTTLDLTGERAHYLKNVLRLRAGDRLRCFDGSGGEHDARIEAAGRRGVRLAIERLVRRLAPPGVALTLIQVMPRGPRLTVVLQKATELGVTHIRLAESLLSTARPAPSRLEGRMEHWRGVIRAAAEQSGRVLLPELRAPQSLPDALAGAGHGARWMLVPDAPEPLAPGGEPADTTVLVGPEGGFTREEVREARAAGFRPAGLGELTLRAETAPLAALAVIRQAWGWRPSL